MSNDGDTIIASRMVDHSGKDGDVLSVLCASVDALDRAMSIYQHLGDVGMVKYGDRLFFRLSGWTREETS